MCNVGEAADVGSITPAIGGMQPVQETAVKYWDNWKNIASSDDYVE